MNKILILMIGLALLSGCSTYLTKKSYEIDQGMTKADVIKLMGIPDRRSWRDKGEALQYSEISGFGQCSYIVVWLYDGLVSGVTSRSGASVGGCGLGAAEVDWGQMPSKKIELKVIQE